MLQEDVSWACDGSSEQVNHVKHAMTGLNVSGSFSIHFTKCLCTARQFCKEKCHLSNLSH